MNQYPQAARRPRKRHPVLFALSMISLIVVAGTVTAAMVAAGGHPAAVARHGKIWHMLHEHVPVQPVSTQPAAPQFSIAQQQAILSAESYLQTGGGFSKAGLISQLDSKYGDGFSRKLAVFAVNHIKVNWRRQAVISARSYMQAEPGWSYSGLVDQLHSRYGAQFTLAQAEYAAKAVGL